MVKTFSLYDSRFINKPNLPVYCLRFVGTVGENGGAYYKCTYTSFKRVGYSQNSYIQRLAGTWSPPLPHHKDIISYYAHSLQLRE